MQQLRQLDFTKDQRRIIAETMLPKETPESQVDLFIEQAIRTGLDPFRRQLIGSAGSHRGEFRLTIVTTIDGFRSVAYSSGDYAGQSPQEWCGGDKVWTDIWLDKDVPAGARCGVFYKGSSVPSPAVISWDESPGPKEIKKSWSHWKSAPAHMLSKCAEALAIRKAFPTLIGGLYTEDEMAIEPKLELVQEASNSGGKDGDGITPGGKPVNGSGLVSKAKELLTPSNGLSVDGVINEFKLVCGEHKIGAADITAHVNANGLAKPAVANLTEWVAQDPRRAQRFARDLVDDKALRESMSIAA